MPTKTYDVTLSFPGAVGVQSKVRVIQSVSGAVTAAESAPSGSSEGVSVSGRTKVFLGVGTFVNITDVDLVLWGLSGGTWTIVEGGSFSTLTTETFLGVFDVRGYNRLFLQVSAISTPGSPSVTREYKILGVDPPRLPRAHVVNEDLANLDSFTVI